MEISEKTQNVIKWPESNKNIDLITFFVHGGLLTHKNILPKINWIYDEHTLFQTNKRTKTNQLDEFN